MDGIWDLNDSNRYTTRQVHIDELKQIELDQGRRMNASEFWVCKVGLLEQTDEENFVFEEREGSSALKDLLISVTRTASNTPEPLAVFDIFGEEVCMNLAEQSELPHT